MLISTILKAIDLASKLDIRRLRDDAQYRLTIVRTLGETRPAKR